MEALSIFYFFFFFLFGLVIMFGLEWFFLKIAKKHLAPLLPIIQGEIVTNFLGGTVILKGIWQKERIEIKVQAYRGERGAIPQDLFITLYQHFPFSLLKIKPKAKGGFVVLSGFQKKDLSLDFG